MPRLGDGYGDGERGQGNGDGGGWGDGIGHGTGNGDGEPDLSNGLAWQGKESREIGTGKGSGTSGDYGGSGFSEIQGSYGLPVVTMDDVMRALSIRYSTSTQPTQEKLI